MEVTNKEHTAVALPSPAMSSSSSLSAHMLMSLDSVISMKSGRLQKKDNGWLPYFFPFLFPRYKERLCILVGNYFFKFKGFDDDKPKGVPLPLDSITCSVSSDEKGTMNGSTHYLILRTIRKTYTFKGVDREECLSWANAIKQRKQIAIKEKLGHVHLDDSVKRINMKCEKMFKGKLKREGGASSITLLDSTSTMNPMI